jgi:hypothetical protein
MSAVSPETRSVEATVKVGLGVLELLGDLGLGLVLMLGRVVVYTMVSPLNIKAHGILTPLLTIANPLAVDQPDHDESKDNIGSGHILLKLGRAQNGIRRNA